LFAYLIWQDGRDRDRDPETEETFKELRNNALLLIFLWPFILINLGKQLEQEKHKSIWVASIVCFTLLLAAFSGIGGYLALGIFIALAKGIGYLYYAYKIPVESQQETE
jgi:hypothetical protein